MVLSPTDKMQSTTGLRIVTPNRVNRKIRKNVQGYPSPTPLAIHFKDNDQIFKSSTHLHDLFIRADRQIIDYQNR